MSENAMTSCILDPSISHFPYITIYTMVPAFNRFQSKLDQMLSSVTTGSLTLFLQRDGTFIIELFKESDKCARGKNSAPEL